MSKASETIIERNLEAYNRRDINSFLQSFAEDAVIIDLKSGDTRARGIAAIRNLYAELFRNSPTLRSQVLNRMTLGNLVADHEVVTGRTGGDLEILIIYEVMVGKITKVWMARETAVQQESST